MKFKVIKVTSNYDTIGHKMEGRRYNGSGVYKIDELPLYI